MPAAAIVLFGIAALVTIVTGLAIDIPAIAILGVVLAIVGIVAALRQKRTDDHPDRRRV